MKLRFEFLTVFRRKTGLESLIVEAPEGSGRRLTVLEALAALQNRLEHGELKFLDQGRMGRGILVFQRTSGGGLERVFDPEGQRIVEGEILVLSTAMEGG